jgi:electron transfer flavoprotein alpha subunit
MLTESVWVIAEHSDKHLHDATLEVLGEARSLADQLEGELCAALLGHRVGDLTTDLIRHGADAVYVVQHPLLERYTTDAYVYVLTQVIRKRDPFMVMLGGTPNGQDLAPRLAARLRVALVTDCVMVKLNSQGVVEMTKPTYQNKVHTTLTCSERRPSIVTIRPGARGVEQPNSSRQGRVANIHPEIEDLVIQTRPVKLIKGDPRRIDLSEAELIVAGGRGVGAPDRWEIIEALAEALGAAVGGSRIPMDKGSIGRERVIGQTGKTIRPKLYLAVGISGATQHMGGVRDSELIVAINNDPAAPILKQADLGIVGDLHEILPVLIEKLQQRKSRND